MKSSREILGIEFCKTCGEDTMPNIHTGLCFFCDRAPSAKAVPAAVVVLPHCRRGHDFTPENTRYDNDGTRRCRECAKENRKRYDERRRQAA